MTVCVFVRACMCAFLHKGKENKLRFLNQDRMTIEFAYKIRPPIAMPLFFL